MNKQPLGFVLAAALAGGTQSLHANLLTNGGFETVGPSPYTPIAGWNSSGAVGDFPITLLTSPFTGAYPDGSGVAAFGGGDAPGGSIWQTIPTVVSLSYTLTFDYGALANANPQTMTAYALNDSTQAELAHKAVSAIGTYQLNQSLAAYSMTFVATSGTTSIKFVDTSASSLNTDGILDNVVVTAAVPAPGTALLMLAGVGAMARRRGWKWSRKA